MPYRAELVGGVRQRPREDGIMAWATQCPPRKRGICWLARGGRGPLMWVGLTREAVSGEEALGSGAEKRASEKEGAGGAAPCEGACESWEERVPTSPAEIRGKRTSKFPISTVASRCV